MGMLNCGASGFVTKNNELGSMKNCYEYKLGELKKVPGYDKWNSTSLGGEITNLMSYADNSGSYGDYYMVATIDTGSGTIMKSSKNGTTWNTINIGSHTLHGCDYYSQVFLDKLFLTNQNRGEMFLLDGTTFHDDSTDSDLTNAPQGRHIIEYKDRLYVGNCKISGLSGYGRHYVRFSSPPVSGGITWNSDDSFNVGSAREMIMGMAKIFDRLIIFKETSMWSYDGTSLRKEAEIGCVSEKSIQVTGSSLIWANTAGIWRWSGGEPQLISKKIQPFITETVGYLNNSFSVLDGNVYTLYLNRINITIDEYEYTHTWVCFDTITEKFYIKCSYHEPLCVAKKHYSFSEYITLFGDKDGFIYEFAKEGDDIYSHDGNPIDSFFVTQSLDHGSPTTINVNPEMTIFSKNPQGMKMAIQTDNSNNFDKDNVVILKKNIETKQLNTSGSLFKYKFYENSVNDWSFNGFVVDVKEREDRK